VGSASVMQILIRVLTLVIQDDNVRAFATDAHKFGSVMSQSAPSHLLVSSHICRNTYHSFHESCVEHLRLIDYIPNIQYFTEIHVVSSELRLKTFSNTKLSNFSKRQFGKPFCRKRNDHQQPRAYVAVCPIRNRHFGQISYALGSDLALPQTSHA
jgi:hypothetical protein